MSEENPWQIGNPLNIASIRQVVNMAKLAIGYGNPGD